MVDREMLYLQGEEECMRPAENMLSHQDSLIKLV